MSSSFVRGCLRVCVPAALLLIAVAAFGAGKEETESVVATATGGPVYLRDASPVSFDWYVDESWFTRVKWGQDLVSQYITKKTGVKLNIIIPAGNAEEKKNIMIASGDLPDFLSMGWWYPHWKKMIEAGQLWSLDELSQKYDPTFFEVTRDSVLGWYRSEDGKTYVYPNNAWGVEDVTPDVKALYTYIGLSVRKDIYEALGRPDMRTPEGFLSALQLAKARFPSLEGQPIIPFLFGYEFQPDGNRAVDDNLIALLGLPEERPDGTVNKYGLRKDPELVTWIKTLRKAFELGLISKDQFTDKSAQVEEKITSGRVFATLYALNGMAQKNGAFYARDPNTIYLPVDGPTGTQRARPRLGAGGISGWLITMVSRKTAHPARAVQFMHYYLSEEGQSDFFYGDPSMYQIVDGQRRMRDDLYALRDTDEALFCAKYGGRDAYFMLLSSPMYDRWRQDIPAYEQLTIDWARDKNVDNSEFAGIEPDPSSPAGIEFEKSKAKWGALLPKMLVASGDQEVDRLMAEYAAVDDKAAQVYLPVMQRVYEENKRKLGK